jgi:hypothetical protein
MNTAQYNALPAPDTAVTNDLNQDFVHKLRDIVADLHQKLNNGQFELASVVGLGVCTVQLDGLSTCILSDSAEKPMSPGLHMASAILATCLQAEQDSRVGLLLSKAQKLTEQALKIRTGEILTSTLH